MNNKIKCKYTQNDFFFNPPTFQQLNKYGLIGRRIGEVNIIDYHDNPGDNYIDDGLVCQVKNCINQADKPLEIIIFMDENIVHYSDFIGKRITADAGNFYYPGWQEIPTYEVKGLRIAGDEK